MRSRFTFFGRRSVFGLACRSMVAITVVLNVGCGGAAGPDYRSPYVSLSGVISSSEIATPSQVRVALVWKHRDPEGNLLRAAQELAVSAQFPIQFRLDITALPPAEALNQRFSNGQYDPNWRYATGTLLVYEDVDGNGVLDLVSTDAETTVDRVLGAPDHLSIFYVEGSAVRRGGSGAQPGFNLRRELPVVDPPPGDSTCLPVATQQYLPLSTEIPVSLTAATELSREMCAVTGPGSSGGGCTGPNCTSAPQGAQVTCNADRTAFVSKLCQAPRGLCGSTSCEYGCGRRSPSDPVPPQWPCR